MSPATSQSHWSPAKRSRAEAASRPRRIIFNDDAQDVSLDDADTPAGFLGHRIAPLVGTQVGTVSWSVLCGQFDAPCYDCHVQPIYGDAHGGPVAAWPKVTSNVKTLTREHRCPLHLVTDFAHAHGVEALASMRMNDVHDSFLGPHAMTTWKLTHPQYMVDTQGMLPEMELYATAFDFRHEPVRQRKLEVIDDIGQRYDVDGFELDYIRHPVLFSRSMRGEPCTDAEVDVITSMMRQVRRITDAAAQRRGRPILIATRTPDSFATCRDFGMDIGAWLEQDLVDILIAGGGYAPYALPLTEWVAAAAAHGVPVYPCVNQAVANGVSGGSLLEGVRGLAANWYRAGASGLYFWNLGTPFGRLTGDELNAKRRSQYACLYEVGDPQALIGTRKIFSVDRDCGNAHRYYSRVSSPWSLPMTSKRGLLRTGVIGRVPLAIGDAVEVHPPSQATLTVALDDPQWRNVLLFRLNGQELTDGRLEVAADADACDLHFAVCPTLLRIGRNTIEVAAKHVEIPETLVNLTAMRLEVSYA